MKEALVDGFLTFKSDPEYRKRNEWWRITEEKHIPYVLLKTTKKYHHVEMDLLHYSKLPTMDQIKEAVNELDALIQRQLPFRSKNQKRWISGFYGTVCVNLKLPAPYGPDLAEILIEIATAGGDIEPKQRRHETRGSRTS